MANEKAHSARHATATVTVRSHETQSFAGGAPELAVLSIEEEFSGEFDGRSTVRAIQLKRLDGAIMQRSLQRVWGSIGGRTGTYVLEGESQVLNGKIEATWSVVAGSGTEQLASLRGEGRFAGEFGKGSTAWLDYWFDEV